MAWLRRENLRRKRDYAWRRNCRRWVNSRPQWMPARHYGTLY